MYAYLEGQLAHVDPTYAVLDVGGIGYHIRIPLTTYDKVKELHGAKARLFIHLQVAEDAHTLYGFVSEEDKTVFTTLISVSGVGPAIGLMALSQMQARELATAISTGNAAALTRIKGLGAKTAQRLTLELKGKMLKIFAHDASSLAPSDAGIYSIRSNREEALAALNTLGLSKAVAEKSLDQILADEPDLSTEDLIRRALRR